MARDKSYYAARSADRQLRGLCASCAEPCVPGKKLCAAHGEKSRAYMRGLKADGLCQVCHAPLDTDITSKCGACVAKVKAKHVADRLLVLTAYGSICACCGEAEELFLSLDHVNDDGGMHRREQGGGSGHTLVRWAIKHNFPPSLRILCMNCNAGRYRNGGTCPHMD